MNLTDYIMLEGDLEEIDEWTLRFEAWTDQHNSMFDLCWDHYEECCYMCNHSNDEIFHTQHAFIRSTTRVYNEKIYIDGKYI